VQAELADGRLLGRNEIAEVTGFGDYTIAAAVDELLLMRSPWPVIQKRGYVGIGERWDRV
jgi:hypothetical protein